MLFVSYNANKCERTKRRRWVLACRDSVAVARGLCEEVTVVAHSTGAPVAALVAENFDVDRLVFTGPNFLSQAGDLW